MSKHAHHHLMPVRVSCECAAATRSGGVEICACCCTVTLTDAPDARVDYRCPLCSGPRAVEVPERIGHLLAQAGARLHDRRTPATLQRGGPPLTSADVEAFAFGLRWGDVAAAVRAECGGAS